MNFTWKSRKSETNGGCMIFNLEFLVRVKLNSSHVGQGRVDDLATLSHQA